MSYQRSIRIGGGFTPGLKIIIIVNVIFFILEKVIFIPGIAGKVSLFDYYLSLWPILVIKGEVWRLFTYSLLHLDPVHLFFNLLALFFFSGDIESYIGTKRFLFLYLFSVLGGGLFSLLFLFGPPKMIIGCSAGVFGVLTAYALYFPNREALLWFIIPIKMKYLMIGLGLFVLLQAITGSNGGIAHLAHLGGIVFSYIYIKRFWNLSLLIREIKYAWRKRRFKAL